MLLAADFLQCVGADVMIRDHQSILGNERSAAAGIEADARFLQVLEPLRRWLEIVFFFELLERRRIKEPHPLIGRCCHGEANETADGD